jgi:hypothetical protein
MIVVPEAPDAGTARGGMGPVRQIVVRLPEPVAYEAARCAAICRLDLGRWVGQVVEVYLARARCAHRAPRPDAAAPADDPSPELDGS